MKCKNLCGGSQEVADSTLCWMLQEQGAYESYHVHICRNLIRQADVEVFFVTKKPKYVIDVAAFEDGFKANSTASVNFLHQIGGISAYEPAEVHQAAVRQFPPACNGMEGRDFS